MNGSPNFHVSGARILYRGPPAAGIDSILIGGRPLDDRVVYAVVQSNFNAAGGDNLGFGPAAISIEPVGITDLDALIAYLKSVPQPVTAPNAPRLILRP
jgi:hypothetical protein